MFGSYYPNCILKYFVSNNTFFHSQKTSFLLNSVEQMYIVLESKHLKMSHVMMAFSEIKLNRIWRISKLVSKRLFLNCLECHNISTESYFMTKGLWKWGRINIWFIKHFSNRWIKWNWKCTNKILWWMRRWNQTINLAHLSFLFFHYLKRWITYVSEVSYKKIICGLMSFSTILKW